MAQKISSSRWVLTDLDQDLPGFSDAFREFCQEQGLDDTKIFELELSLEELIVNTFTHGYKEGGSVVVESKNVDGNLEVCVQDKAPHFNLLEDAPPPRLGGQDRPPVPKGRKREGGLGIHLVKSLNEKVEYYGGEEGNLVVITKSIN